MTGAAHLDLEELGREITLFGIAALLDLVADDQAIVMHCVCGISSLVPAGLDRLQRLPFHEVWRFQHARCSAGGNVK